MRAKRPAQELRTEHPGPGLQPGLDLDFSALEYHATTQKARNEVNRPIYNCLLGDMAFHW